MKTWSKNIHLSNKHFIGKWAIGTTVFLNEFTKNIFIQIRKMSKYDPDLNLVELHGEDLLSTR